MASIPVRRRSVHTAVEAIQDESSSGEGALKTPGAGAAVGCGRCDSNKEVKNRDRDLASHLISSRNLNTVARLVDIVEKQRQNLMQAVGSAAEERPGQQHVQSFEAGSLEVS